MRRITLSIFVTVIALTLSGCGNSSSSTSAEQSEAAPKVVNVKSDFVFMSDFVSALQGAGVDCLDYVKNSEVSVLAKDEGSCTYKGSTLYLALFADAKTTPELVDALKSFDGYFLTSNNWAINVEDEATAKNLQEMLGVGVL
jgi:ABC-type glycerol-3-phosphate transport system substrate-binding protein